MRYREGLGRRGVIWVLGTAGVYGGLYGFATNDRTFIGLGIALSALVVTGWAATEVGVSSWWLRYRPLWVAATAEVLAASAPPPAGAYGRCELELEVAALGLPVTEVRIVEFHVWVPSWPEVGDTLPVLVDTKDVRRIKVQWQDFRQERPASRPADDSDSRPVPPWASAPESRPALTADDHDDDLLFDERDAPWRDGSPRQPTAVDTPPMLIGEEPGPEYAAPAQRSPEARPPEGEPTRAIARYLLPGERYRGEWQRHWVRPVVRYLSTFGVAAIGEILVGLHAPADIRPVARAGVVVLGGLISLHVLTAWQVGRFVLTDRRVMLVEGALRRRVSMAPLPGVADLRFEQSLGGRVLNYGDFVIERKGLFTRMRLITTLPDPDQLYLRLVEGMYEAAAVNSRPTAARDAGVDARAGIDDEADDEELAPPPVTEMLTQAFREAIYGPALANYDGWVSVAVLRSDGSQVPITGDRQVLLEPGRAYQLRVFIAQTQVTNVTEPLVVNGGVEREAVEFAAELDSDQRGLRQPARRIEAGPAGGSVTFTLRIPPGGFVPAPWLWVRVSQQDRLLQSIELVAGSRAALE